MDSQAPAFRAEAEIRLDLNRHPYGTTTYLGLQNLHHPVSKTEYEDDVRLHLFRERKDQTLDALLFYFPRQVTPKERP